ncbi:MAG: hypothetical protein RL358_453 [Pseudomonadota bacterium]|jgi:DNA-binding response OmpR family regulator
MKKILIVDDEENLRKLLLVVLSYADYKLYFASSGEEALEMAARIRPDVVILDVLMPGKLNGLEVCRKIKSIANLKHAFVILLTGLTQQADKEAGAETGANAYVEKPFSPMRLIELIESRLHPFKGS